MPAQLPVARVAGGDEPFVVTDATFQRDVMQAGDLPVVLDCWAAWCGPCRALAPVLEELARESRGRYRVAKLDTDANTSVPQQFRVSALPTLLFFKSGKLVDRIVGLVPKHTIAQKLEAIAG